MSQFLFLYRGGRRGDASPAEMQQQMQRWMTWMKELKDKGVLKEAGQPLELAGKVVSKQSAVTDGPYAEKDLVCGFSIVEAEDLNHAAELSRGCPIFQAGGLVEVRPVLKM
jgi:hypothetical protein